MNGTTGLSNDRLKIIAVVAMVIDHIATVTLTATVKPDNVADKTVAWTSNNKAVATVNNGVVTAVAAGTATITVA